MTADEPILTEPCEALREAMIDYVEEFCRAGEPFWQQEVDEVRGDFEGYVRGLRDRAAGINVPPGRVPDSHYWLVRGGRVVATTRLRHRLNESLEIRGGHIGYEVRPSERRKGYAKRMLHLALDKARQLGLRRVLVTCDTDNVASAKVIQSNGGVLHSEVIAPDTSKLTQRYWIEL